MRASFTQPIETEQQLDEALSRPAAADAAAMASLSGDLMVIGVGGKMGPSLAALAKRACHEAGTTKKVIGVARFSTPGLRELLEKQGISTIRCDVLNRGNIEALPDCPNVVFMVGYKFGSGDHPEMTWATNAYAPALVAERFSRSRIVALSSGNVYPFWPVESKGPAETDPVGPLGDYAQSVLGRERMLEYFSRRDGIPLTILRLNYAIELRYGILRDIADKVCHHKPINLSMGYANVIWQRDANSVVLRCFDHCSTPPFVLNLTGAEAVSIRSIAGRFGTAFGVDPILEGEEAPTALLSNASRCERMFGPPEVALDQMIEYVASWVKRGGASLGKPTHYEERKGAF